MNTRKEARDIPPVAGVIYSDMSSDADILTGSLKHPDLFEKIVDRYEKPFIRKALSILRNEDDAYDAVQETFVRIYSKADRFKKKEGASFGSWAYAILINRCRTIYRKRERRRAISYGLEPEYAEIIPDQAAKSPIPLHPGAARYYREVGLLK